jgi:formylglycine-generating enzyme required for sulfatase activity
LLLRRWNQEAKLEEVSRTLPTFKERGDRRWFVDSEGNTMVMIDGPVESRVGSPPNDPNRRPIEILHSVPIDESFAIATKEVTIEQFRRFQRARPIVNFNEIPPAQNHLRDDREPRGGVTWYQAVHYCSWLSSKEGLEPAYNTNADNEYKEGMSIPPDFQKRSGYRLPTEAEWEYACRAGTVASRYFGESDDLLKNYAWVDRNTECAHPSAQLKPNDLGLFDMLGNVYEHCSDIGDAYNHIENSKSLIKVFDTSIHVMKGGWHRDLAEDIRSSRHNGLRNMDRADAIGFRIVRTIPRSP